MQRLISALMVVIPLGSALSGAFPSNGPGLAPDPGRYYDIIKHQRPFRLGIAPTMLARADN